MFEFRKINIDELEKVSQITKLAYNVPYKNGGMTSLPHESENLQDEVVTGKTVIFCATLENEIVGTVRYDKREDGTIYLSQLAVIDKYREKGLGKKLMEAIENFAKNEGHSTIYLGAMREKELPEYYKKMGYVEDSILQRPTYELVEMKKEL